MKIPWFLAYLFGYVLLQVNSIDKLGVCTSSSQLSGDYLCHGLVQYSYYLKNGSTQAYLNSMATDIFESSQLSILPALCIAAIRRLICANIYLKCGESDFYQGIQSNVSVPYQRPCKRVCDDVDLQCFGLVSYAGAGSQSCLSVFDYSDGTITPLPQQYDNSNNESQCNTMKPLSNVISVPIAVYDDKRGVCNGFANLVYLPPDNNSTSPDFPFNASLGTDSYLHQVESSLISLFASLPVWLSSGCHSAIRQYLCEVYLPRAQAMFIQNMTIALVNNGSSASDHSEEQLSWADLPWTMQASVTDLLSRQRTYLPSYPDRSVCLQFRDTCADYLTFIDSSVAQELYPLIYCNRTLHDFQAFNISAPTSNYEQHPQAMLFPTQDQVVASLVMPVSSQEIISLNSSNNNNPQLILSVDTVSSMLISGAPYYRLDWHTQPNIIDRKSVQLFAAAADISEDLATLVWDEAVDHYSPTCPPGYVIYDRTSQLSSNVPVQIIASYNSPMPRNYERHIDSRGVGVLGTGCAIGCIGPAWTNPQWNKLMVVDRIVSYVGLPLGLLLLCVFLSIKKRRKQLSILCFIVSSIVCSAFFVASQGRSNESKFCKDSAHPLLYADGPTMCVTQAIVIFYSLLVNCMSWCLQCISMFEQVVMGRKFSDNNILHVVLIFALPLVSTLVAASWGLFGYDQQSTWCFMSSHTIRSGRDMILFYLPLGVFVCFGGVLILSVIVTLALRLNNLKYLARKGDNALTRTKAKGDFRVLRHKVKNSRATISFVLVFLAVWISILGHRAHSFLHDHQQYDTQSPILQKWTSCVFRHFTAASSSSSSSARAVLSADSWQQVCGEQPFSYASYGAQVWLIMCMNGQALMGALIFLLSMGWHGMQRRKIQRNFIKLTKPVVRRFSELGDLPAFTRLSIKRARKMMRHGYLLGRRVKPEYIVEEGDEEEEGGKGGRGARGTAAEAFDDVESGGGEEVQGRELSSGETSSAGGGARKLRALTAGGEDADSNESYDVFRAAMPDFNMQDLSLMSDSLENSMSMSMSRQDASFSEF